MVGLAYVMISFFRFLSCLIVIMLLCLLVSDLSVSVVYIAMPVAVIWFLFWLNLVCTSIYIIIFRRFFMNLNIYTVFNRIDGSSDQLVLARTDARVATDFVNGINSRNKELEAKNYPLINLSNYELRKIGVFEDTTSEISPLPPTPIPFP